MKEKEIERLKNLKEFENNLHSTGLKYIAGIDEAGRGPLAGPVVVGIAIMKPDSFIEGVNDSKKLSEKKRNTFYDILMKDAIAIGVGIKSNKIIDEVNIYEATKLAMKDAINNLSVKPEHVLIDAMPLELDIPTTSIIKGDALSESIAAASVIAKVTRDRMMYELDKEYPEYGFAKHKGYPTKEHINNVKQYGLLDNYRFTFKPISVLINDGDFSERQIRKTHI